MLRLFDQTELLQMVNNFVPQNLTLQRWQFGYSETDWSAVFRFTSAALLEEWRDNGCSPVSSAHNYSVPDFKGFMTSMVESFFGRYTPHWLRRLSQFPWGGLINWWVNWNTLP